MEDGLRRRIGEIEAELARLREELPGPAEALIARTARVNILVQDLRAQVHRAHAQKG